MLDGGRAWLGVTEQLPVGSAQPLLSVILCTHGRRPEHLRRCVTSLRAAAATPGVEVVVVDNAERPLVRDLLGPAVVADPALRVVHEPRRGLDHARNSGLSAARGDLIAYVDDDCEVDPTWPAAIMRAFADSSVDCVTGRVVAANGDLATAQWFERRFSFDRGELPQRFHRDDTRPWFPVYPYHLGTGCNMAFRRGLLERIGGFDPALDMGSLVGGGGDLDMFARVIDAGAIAAYEPRAVVHHHHRARRRSLAYQFLGYGATPSALAAKWVVSRPGQRRAALGFLTWYLRDTLRRALRRDDLTPWVPRYLIAVELVGELWGPVGYAIGRFRARVSGR